MKKWNKYNMRQDRNFIVSDMLIYNFKQKSIRRSIELHLLTGITKALYPGSIEFVIHIKDEADMRLDYEERDAFIDLIKRNYYNLTNTHLPIYGITKGKTLQKFETTTADAKKGLSKMPLS